MGSGVSLAKAERQRQERVRETCRLQTSRVARRKGSTANTSMRTFAEESQRRATVRKAFESICESPQELSLFKSFLHAEYGIALWDLWRNVEWYNAHRDAATRAGEEAGDAASFVGGEDEEARDDNAHRDAAEKAGDEVGEEAPKILSDEELLTYCETFFDKYLAPRAPFFVHQVPGAISSPIAKALDARRVPDCSELARVVKNALTDEGLMGRFAVWLKSEEAEREAAVVDSLETQPSYRASASDRSSIDEEFLRRASICGDMKPRSSVDTSAVTVVCDRRGPVSAMYAESFRGHFGDHRFGGAAAAGQRSLVRDPSRRPRSHSVPSATPRRKPSSRKLSLDAAQHYSDDDYNPGERARHHARQTFNALFQRRRRDSEDSTPSAADGPSAADALPTSRSFGLTRVLLDQWKDDVAEGEQGSLADHPFVTDEPVTLPARNNASSRSLLSFLGSGLSTRKLSRDLSGRISRSLSPTRRSAS